MPAIVRGAVFLVDDAILTLLPPEERVTHDSRRRFVILSRDERNLEDAWPVVLGCPISGSARWKTRYDVPLAANEAGAQKKCWIRVPALQPLMKRDLGDLSGHLSVDKLEILEVRIAEYIGLIPEQA